MTTANLTLLTGALCAALAASGAGAAGVYRCEVDGRVTYSQTRCAPNAARVEVDTSPTGLGGPLSSGAAAMVDNFDQRMLAGSGRVAPGMNRQRVEDAWGSPTRINRSISGGAVREQWVYRYGRGVPTQYVYVENGRVVSVTENPDPTNLND